MRRAILPILVAAGLVAPIGVAVAEPASAAGCHTSATTRTAKAWCSGVHNTKMIQVLVKVCNHGGRCSTAGGEWVYQDSSKVSTYTASSGTGLLPDTVTYRTKPGS